MKHSLLILLPLSLLLACSLGTNNGEEADIPAMDERDPAGECLYKPSGRSVKSTYPFSVADKITIVSYPPRPDSYTNDTLIVAGAFTVKEIKEEIVLSASQTDTLFSILYDHLARPGDRAVADCYSPRHSLVFHKNGKAVAFLEVCLDCGGALWSKNTSFGEFCNEKMCMLQALFKKAGIKYGIMDELCRRERIRNHHPERESRVDILTRAKQNI